MNPIRIAILVAFVGATLWVFAPSLAGAVPADMRALGMCSKRATSLCDRLHDLLASRTTENEIAVDTIAAVAWILAGLVK